MTTQDSRPQQQQDHWEAVWERSGANDLVRFESEGGPEIPEPAAPQPQESNNK